ncbi:hypothetical protein K7X08_011481 [Anisodus acutangulus]|uniref:Uncharacterized protein n=1 Tax=Anisodus acutangulus TaxID=402998 RepID=A0A9Q1RLE9_9SOLA|nr:hypothetical protein K7X08_011481 [Anisodus acutangulus]
MTSCRLGSLRCLEKRVLDILDMPPIIVQGQLFHNMMMIEVKNVFSTEDERLLLDLEELAFEHVPEPSQSQRSNELFYTQTPKADMGQSSRGNVESRNVDMKKELESFGVHVDSKFA